MPRRADEMPFGKERFGIVAGMNVDGVFFVTTPDIDNDPILDQREVARDSRFSIGDCIEFFLGHNGEVVDARYSSEPLKTDFRDGRLVVETVVAFYPKSYCKDEDVDANRIAYSPKLHNVACRLPTSNCERNHLYQVFVERLSDGNRKEFMGKCVAWVICDACLVDTKEQQEIVEMPWYEGIESGKLRLPFEELKVYYKSFSENYEGIVTDFNGADALVWSHSIRVSKVLFSFGRDQGLHIGDRVEFNCKPLLHRKNGCFLECKKYSVVTEASYDSESDPRRLIEVEIVIDSDEKLRPLKGNFYLNDGLLGSIEIPAAASRRIPLGQKVNILVRYKPWEERSQCYFRFECFSDRADTRGDYSHDGQQNENWRANYEHDFYEESGPPENRYSASHHRTHSDEPSARPISYTRTLPASVSQGHINYQNTDPYVHDVRNAQYAYEAPDVRHAYEAEREPYLCEFRPESDPREVRPEPDPRAVLPAPYLHLDRSDPYFGEVRPGLRPYEIRSEPHRPELRLPLPYVETRRPFTHQNSASTTISRPRQAQSSDYDRRVIQDLRCGPVPNTRTRYFPPPPPPAPQQRSAVHNGTAEVQDTAPISSGNENSATKRTDAGQQNLLSDEDRLRRPIFGSAPPQPARRPGEAAAKQQEASGSEVDRGPKKEAASGFGKNLRQPPRNRVPSHLCHTSAFITGKPMYSNSPSGKAGNVKQAESRVAERKNVSNAPSSQSQRK